MVATKQRRNLSTGTDTPRVSAIDGILSSMADRSAVGDSVSRRIEVVGRDRERRAMSTAMAMLMIPK